MGHSTTGHKHIRLQLSIYFAPAAPHDGGLAIGGVLMAFPPRLKQGSSGRSSSWFPSVARGLQPCDATSLAELAAREGASPFLLCKPLLYAP